MRVSAARSVVRGEVLVPQAAAARIPRFPAAHTERLNRIGLVATSLPLRWALGGSRGRSRVFGSIRGVSTDHCDESRVRRGFAGLRESCLASPRHTADGPLKAETRVRIPLESSTIAAATEWFPGQLSRGSKLQDVTRDSGNGSAVAITATVSERSARRSASAATPVDRRAAGSASERRPSHGLPTSRPTAQSRIRLPRVSPYCGRRPTSTCRSVAKLGRDFVNGRFEAASGLVLGLVVLDGQADQRHRVHDLMQHGSRERAASSVM